LWPDLLFRHVAAFTNILIAYLDTHEVIKIRHKGNDRKTKKVAKKQKTHGRESREMIFIDRNVDLGKRAMQAGDPLL